MLLIDYMIVRYVSMNIDEVIDTVNHVMLYLLFITIDRLIILVTKIMINR